MSRPSRYVVVLVVLALAVGLQTVPAAAQPAGGLSARTATQIEALARTKAGRSAAQSKVESALLTTAQLATGRSLPAGVTLQPMVRTDRAGRAVVDVRADVTPALLEQVRRLGGLVHSSSATAHLLRADLPLAAVEPLAALPAVHRLTSLAGTAVTTHVGDAPERVTKTQRADDLRQRVVAALSARRRASGTAPGHSAVSQGSVVSEGDRVLGVDTVRAQKHLSGIGVTVGVLSDGVDSLQASITSGDLPAGTRVLPGSAGAGDEGTAMLEIVHDLAPKAGLLFATAFDSETGFADNIRALAAAGADVIVDDVLYYDEPAFQDGVVARAVSDVTSQGVAYFSSAGNDGNVDDGTSGNYEGDFRSSGRAVGKYAGTAHDFDLGSGVQSVNPLSAGSAGAPAVLQWADPWGHAGDDYDLYAVDANGDVVAFSNDTQDGDDNPYEILGIPSSSAPLRLAVVRFGGATRYFQLSALGGRFVASGSLRAYTSPGVTRGHATVPTAFSVAAAPAHDPLPFELEAGDPANPSGPYPGLFTTGQASERFTSDGPRRVFFSASGQPVTPGNFSSTGGHLRAKPDVTAPDGVRTSVPGYENFFGTSAAAPHAAALAALALSGHPGLGASALRSAFTGQVMDVERPGRDRDTGYGIAATARLLTAAGATGQAYPVGGDPAVTASTDGDAFLEPGETADVSVPVLNLGDVTATGVQVTLTTPTAGVTISPAARSYGSVGADLTASQSFRVKATRAVPLGTELRLTVSVTSAAGPLPRRHASALVVGQPSSRVVTSAFTGPAKAIPDSSPDQPASVVLPVTGVGPVSRVTFSIDGSTCSDETGSTTVGLDHTFVKDLVGTLQGPDGTRAVLFNHTGASGNNFCRTVFADSASRPVQLAQAEQAPFTGSWQPAEPLSAFRGRPGDGRWTFSVHDDASTDTGTVRAVSVHVSGFEAPVLTVTGRRR